MRAKSWYASKANKSSWPLADRLALQSMVNVSTSLIHDFDTMGMWPNYSASKNAGTMVMQQIAKDVSASDMQVISFHPGVIFTPSARNAGLSKEAVDWDDGKHSLLLCWDRC